MANYAIFDEQYYLSQYPWLKPAIDAGIISKVFRICPIAAGECDRTFLFRQLPKAIAVSGKLLLYFLRSLF